MHDGKAPTVPGVLSSGVDSLDVATGVGGYPYGRFIILHGAEASGKSTLALHAVAECQSQGGVVIYLDFEHKIDLPYAAALGVDLEAMVLATPDYIEKGFELLVAAAGKVREHEPDAPVLFVWDSLQAAIARRTFDNDFDKEAFSPEANAYARGFAKFVPCLSSTNSILIGISQVRMDLGGFHAREKVAVGKAPLFYASMIMKIKAKKARGTIKKGREGEDIEVNLIKNQVAAPYQVAKFPIHYGSGVDRYAATIEAAHSLGMIEFGKSGWVTFKVKGVEHKVHGAAGMKKLNENTPEVYEGFRQELRDGIGRPATEDEV